MAEANTKVQYLDMVGLQRYDSLIKGKIATDIKSGEYNDAELKKKITANEEDIAALRGRLELFESITYTPVTETQINGLFAE